MAQIDLSKIKRIDKNRNSLHEKVLCTYSVFESAGEKYFQLDTYGRIGREIPGKVSQSLQFDKNVAQFLVELLIKEFDVDLT